MGGGVVLARGPIPTIRDIDAVGAPEPTATDAVDVDPKLLAEKTAEFKEIGSMLCAASGVGGGSAGVASVAYDLPKASLEPVIGASAALLAMGSAVYLAAEPLAYGHLTNWTPWETIPFAP